MGANLHHLFLSVNVLLILRLRNKCLLHKSLRLNSNVVSSWLLKVQLRLILCLISSVLYSVSMWNGDHSAQVRQVSVIGGSGGGGGGGGRQMGIYHII